jgi:hypothetical protein
VPREESSDGSSLVALVPRESSVDSNFEASVSAHGEYPRDLEPSSEAGE